RTVEVGYSGSLRTKVPRESLMLTDDENIIDVQMAVQYRLKDAPEYLFNNSRPDDAVKQSAETAIREVVGRSKMDFVLYEGREQVAIQAQTLAQQILDRYKTGILISSITIQNAQPPEQVQAAFDDAVKAGQDRERAKNEGQAYANDVIPRARGNASRLLQEADGYKQRVIAQSEGDASRFGQVVAEYAKAPVVTRQRMYIDTMQEIYSNAVKVMVDSRSGGNLLMLPLDKLLQQASQDSARAAALQSNVSASSPPGTSGTTPAVIPGSDVDPRSRDGLRNRDRDVR
ncbi:MAG: FtsH protease activity modulator HflK, partial [Burkholderiaceae bacterium]